MDFLVATSIGYDEAEDSNEICSDDESTRRATWYGENYIYKDVK